MTDDNTLYYMRQRYYNPQIKRFINQDILTGSIGNSASLNRYSYVEGNPVSYTDPFGLSPFSYISEPLHNTLDWFGMIPVVGAGFDLINATIYLMEGEPTYALFAAISSVGPADGVKFIIKNGKKSIIGITLTGIFCQTDAGAGLKEDLTGLGQDYITYYGYDQMSNTELALSLTIEIFFGAKSGYDDLNIKKKKVDVDLDDFVPDNATSKVNKIDGDDLLPDNTSAVMNRTDVDNVVANTQGFGGCFVEGTEIKTIEGDKNIEDIHAGDMVYSKNTETGEEGYKEVVRVFKKKTYELVYLTIGDEEIITTPNHPFYVVDEGFVEAGNLQIGDKVETADGEILEIEAITIEYLDEPIQIYNFDVADWHTYYVSEEEVLVHNNCAVGGGTSNLPNRRQALNLAKDKAGVPRSQQPTRQWIVGDDINLKNHERKNYKYDPDPSSHGRYYEYDTPNGKRVVVDHTNDGTVHTHAGQPKGDPSSKTYDFKVNRYQKIKGPDGEHHIYYKK